MRSFMELVHRAFGRRDLPPAVDESEQPQVMTIACPVEAPMGVDDPEPLGSTYEVRRPVRITLDDGRQVDVLAVATYEHGTAEPLRLIYEPLSWFHPKKEER